MRHMGGCTECYTIWWGCRCPLRCEECGAGYRDDGNSNCWTPGCKTGQRRGWAQQDRWEALRREEEAEAEIRCEAVEPAPSEAEADDPIAQHTAVLFEEAERQAEEMQAAGIAPQGSPPDWTRPVLADAEREKRSVTPSEPGPAEPEAQGGHDPLPPSPADPERGSQNATPSPASRRAHAQNGQARKPTARSAARPTSRPDKPAHRPVAERRAAVEALLVEGLSDREIARRAGVSPSTVSAVRKGQEAAKIGA